MKSENQSVSYTRSNCEQEDKGWNAERGYDYYISSLNSEPTTKHWILVNANEYMDILGNGQINNVQAYLKNAGASMLSTGNHGYGCYCYNTQKYYFKVSGSASNYSVNFETWDSGSSRKVRLIFKY